MLPTGVNVVWAPQPGSQTLFLTCPFFEVLYEGTRGPGKTDALLMDFAQHCGRGLGRAWRGVLFRQTYPQLADVIAKSRKWFHQAFPRARYNAAEHTWTWPDGEQLLLRHMKAPDDYWNYHGHEYPWIGWEELTTWSDLKCYDLMKSCCRSSDPRVPRKYRATANPWGRGHNVVKARFIDPAPPGVPWTTDDGLKCVRIRGHWSENKILLAADPGYPKRIAASASNPEQAKAWLDGSWDIVAGGMFDDLWSEKLILPPFPVPAGWRVDRAFDWGSTKPFSYGLWVESDGTPIVLPGRTIHLARGTVVRWAEWYGWDGKNPNTGIRMTDPDIGRGIKEREERWKIRDRVLPGPADAAIFTAAADGRSIAASLTAAGAEFVPSSKGARAPGWQEMRNRMKAGLEAPREEKGLFVVETCRQWLRTVPVLPRSEKDPDDVDTDAEDHAGDETRYKIMTKPVERVARNFDHMV